MSSLCDVSSAWIPSPSFIAILHVENTHLAILPIWFMHFGHSWKFSCLSHCHPMVCMPRSTDPLQFICKPKKRETQQRIKRESKAHMISLLIFGKGSVCSLDPHGKIQWWNPNTILLGQSVCLDFLDSLPNLSGFLAQMWHWLVSTVISLSLSLSLDQSSFVIVMEYHQ